MTVSNATPEPLGGFEERTVSLSPDDSGTGSTGGRSDGGIVRMIRHAVILVHGANSFGQWANDLEGALDEDDWDIQVIRVRYDGVSIAGAILWSYRPGAFAEIEGAFLKAHKAVESLDSTTVIAHSFGTYAVTRVMARKKNRYLRVRTLILVASIAKPGRVSHILKERRADIVINDSGRRDWVCLWAGAAKWWQYHPSGTFGFADATNRYFDKGHDEVIEDAHAREFILPLIEKPETPKASPFPGPYYSQWSFEWRRVVATIGWFFIGSVAGSSLYVLYSAARWVMNLFAV